MISAGAFALIRGGGAEGSRTLPDWNLNRLRRIDQEDNVGVLGTELVHHAPSGRLVLESLAVILRNTGQCGAYLPN